MVNMNELCGKLDGVMVENRMMKERIQALENEMDETKKTRRETDTVQNTNREEPKNAIPTVTANTEKGQDKNESKKQDGCGDGEDEDYSSDGDGGDGDGGDGDGGDGEGEAVSSSKQRRLIKQERSVAMYLKSIAVTDEKDEEIGRSVKEYASKRAIRVMGFHVIRYKACVDAVGCKIFVPESQQHEALVQDVWPQNITCRRWERPDVWQERSRRDLKRRYEERLRDER